MKALLFYFPFYITCLATSMLFQIPVGGQIPGSTLYNVTNGLPVSQSYFAYQDHYGYLWIGGSAGVSRFDGRQFVNYSLIEGLPSLVVEKVFLDSEDRLWIGSSGGMAQFKNNRFISYPTNDKMDITYVFDFYETKEKLLWTLTDKGVYEFKNNIWEKVPLYPGYENSPCRNVVEKNGELYVNYTTGIYCRNKDKWIHIAGYKNDTSFFNVMSLQHNQILVSTLSNIYKIENHRSFPLLKTNMRSKEFFSFLIDSKNRLCIARHNLLEISNPFDWNDFPISINLNCSTFSLNEDKSGNIWMGTTQGLLKVKNISYTAIDKNGSVPLDGIYNIIPLSDRRMIFSSGTKSGLSLYKDRCCQQILPPVSDNKNYLKDPVDGYTYDNENSVWIFTRFRKLMHFDGIKLTDFSNALKLKTTENIYDVKFVKDRNQFFMCADSTLLYGDSLHFSVFIPSNTRAPIIKPTRIYDLKNGLLLLYLDKKGVFAIDSANNLISLIEETGIDGSRKGIQINICFYEDRLNNFWISFPGLGLYEYGLSKNKYLVLKNHFSLKDGLQSNNILAVTSDNKDRVWLANSTGLDILQMDDHGKWKVFNFAKDEELQINESTSERIIADSNNIWLSSPNKILRFKSDLVRLNKEVPNVIIEKVSLAFRETDWSKLADSLYSYYQLPYRPVLKFDHNSLGITFNAVDLSTSNSSPEFSYTLRPLQRSWSLPSKSKFVSFAELPPGKYEFLVKAKERASGWSHPAIFPFEISPPFWSRWWFRLVVILMAAFIITSIFRTRVQKIRHDSFIQNQLKELEMKALKAQMNPHFIYNALNSIQSLFATDKKTEGIHYIGSFSKLLRQVLDNSENNLISLDKEFETIDLYIQLETLRMDMQLQYKKVIPQNIVIEFEKIPPLILQPFVENSLWHRLNGKVGEKEIIISVDTIDDWLVCDITDNGIGRTKARELKSLSLLSHQSKAIEITRKRLIDFNDNAIIPPIEFVDLYNADDSPAGTKVTVRIKRKAGYA